MHTTAERIAENVADVQGRIAVAARRSGRTSDDVTLVAVTKYVGPEEVQAIVGAGCSDIGESRPQELWHKHEALTDLPIRWHMIGHLQRNKVRRTVPAISLLHSGDNERLLATVDQVCGEQSTNLPVLLEVNVSGDSSKHGFPPEELESFLPALFELPNIEIQGLMAMAARVGGADRAREDFSRLRELRDHLRDVGPPGCKLDELSMGMSGDYEVAIEEGATIVRVGSALFEGVRQS